MKALAATRTPGTTEQRWRERVLAWRASGQTADEYAEPRGFAGGTLRWWSSRLGAMTAPRFVQLVPRPPVLAPATTDVVVEVGHARIRVSAGFDAALLADVVRALGKDGQ